MVDDRFLLITTFFGVVLVFVVGFIAGSVYYESRVVSCDCHDNCDNSISLIPANCSNPIYNVSTNYWSCEVD